MSALRAMLPGDEVPQDVLPTAQDSNKTLTIGPGLRFTPPHKINVVVAGTLTIDRKKNAIWIENNGRGKYIPTTGDLVIVTVHHSSVDLYHCAITPYTAFASLPQLAFEGASRKTRPMLQAGSLVYARISLADNQTEPELECVQPSTGKSEGLGELKGGMVFDISLGMARRLMATKSAEKGGVTILEELGEKGLRFEIAVGRNGRVWVDSGDVKTTLLIGKALQDTDEKDLSPEDQSKLVRKLVKGP